MPDRADRTQVPPVPEGRVRSDGDPDAEHLPLAQITAAPAGARYSNQRKLEIFGSLFRGRTDVYPVRWESAQRNTAGYMPDCANKFVANVCNIKTTKCSDCKNQAFKPVDAESLVKHLRGNHTMGLYPVTTGGTCWFLALDFDGKTWKRDVAAMRGACARLDLPVYVERSRSGNGAHAWFFFADAVLAKSARALGHLVLAEARSFHPAPTFASYDRMFPSQDSVPRGAFGNLIALPLQRTPRAAGNSVFLDPELEPYPDEQQWDLLASVRRISSRDLASALRFATEPRRAELSWHTASLFPAHGDGGAVTALPAATTGAQRLPVVPTLGTLRVTVADRIYVDREDLPEGVQIRIRDLAMFSNPEFYRREAARKSTWNTPRVIRRAEVLATQIALPRGCETTLEEFAKESSVGIERIDERSVGAKIDVAFRGTLTALQSRAMSALLPHDFGVLVLPTGAGKTVVATALVACRARSTLVLVNRCPLLEQWRVQLAVFLGIPEDEVGFLGGAKSKPTGRIDVAMIQSLASGDSDPNALRAYGQVIVDECHHAAAPSFEAVLSKLPARYLVGLTATPKRRDGHHPIMHMQLGPIRFQLPPKLIAKQRPFGHKYFVRPTEFSASDGTGLTDLQARLAEDERRNSFILDDTVAALRDGRSPLLLCQRREHVLFLASRLERYASHLFVLMGGVGTRQQRETLAALRALAPDEQRLVIATGSYIGEGFDDPRLDTLLLATPVSWKGVLAQYTGRLHRQHPDKHEVWIFDYFDGNVPALVRMFERRRCGYKALGYTEGQPPDDFELLTDPANDGEASYADVGA